MPYISIAIAAQLLGSQKVSEASPEPSRSPSVLVLRDEHLGSESAVSVWMPIIADGAGKMLSVADLRRLAEASDRVIASEEPSFVVDSLRAGRPRELGHDGGVAGDLSDEPGLDLGIDVFAGGSLPPDLQLQLFDAVEAVEHYFENTLRNAVIGPGGEPQDVILRLKLVVEALNPDVPGASRVRAVSVPMSQVTRKLASPVFGNDGDDLVESPVVGPDGDSFEPTVPSYVDAEGNYAGIGSLRVRYSAPSSAPSGENRVFLTRAQYLALGFGVGSSGPTTQQYDGEIRINSGFQWDYDPSDGASLGQVTRFSFQDYLVREILIQLGWISGIDFLQRDLTILDMYRFSSLASTWEVSTEDSTIVPQLIPVAPAPISTVLGSASEANRLLQSFYASGNTPASFPMDYNPGVNSILLDKGQDLIDASTPGIDFGALGNLISNEVASVPFSGEPPSVSSAAHVSLIAQLSGLSLPAPQPTAPGRPTVRDSNNRFDDGDWPASPDLERTRYPDGAVPTVVGWPAPPRAQWDFNSPVTLAAAGSTNIVAASTAFAGAQLGLVGGLTVQDCDTVSRAPSLLPIAFLPSSDTTRGDNRCLRVFQDWVQGAGIEIRCSTAGAAAPSVRFDIMLSESASSTWRFEYSLNNGVTYGVADLPNGGYIRIATADAYQCGIRFDLLNGAFVPGATTRFRLTAVPPPGSTQMQSVSQAAGGSVSFSSNGTVEFDMITVSPTVGAQLLVDFNQSFRGHMPRLVARGARAHLNFAMAPNALRSTEDTELSMGTGNSFNNARASFMTQTSVTIPPWERFLMGQSSTAASRTIPRGITYWTRDPVAYAGGPTSKAWTPLGSLPDFLSEQELLILDHLGWDITGFTTNEYVPEPGLWADLVGEQLHPPQPAYDPTGSARP